MPTPKDGDDDLFDRDAKPSVNRVSDSIAPKPKFAELNFEVLREASR